MSIVNIILFNIVEGLVMNLKSKIINNRILLDHVEYFLCSVEPDVMVWNCHRLECHLLGVLKVGVRSPDLVEPLYRQQLVLPTEVNEIFTLFLK